MPPEGNATRPQHDWAKTSPFHRKNGIVRIDIKIVTKDLMV